MSQYNLERIFKPGRVAVVGASEKTGSIGNALMKTSSRADLRKPCCP